MNKTKELLEDIKYGIETGKDKETNIKVDGYCLSWKNCKLILNYITNLQQENDRLKQELNCKEYFSSTMPENTEFVILTKNNYDRQQKDIQLELIDYKSRIEKANEFIKNTPLYEIIYDYNMEDELEIQNVSDETASNKLLNILKGKE